MSVSWCRHVFAATAATLAVIGLGGAVSAQDIAVSQTQTGSAMSYSMPLGEDLSAAIAGLPAIGDEAPFPRTPFGNEELKRQKALSSGPAAPQEPTPERGSAVATNCTTNVPAGAGPPDIHGAVGPATFIAVTNRDIGVYHKSDCRLISRVPFATFFGAAFTIAPDESLSNPRVLWDPSSGRFLVAVDSRNSHHSDQSQYFAVSQNDTGTTWWLQRIVLSQGATSFCKRAPGTFWDSPNIGSMTSRWFVTGTDVGNGAVSSDTGAIMVVDKTPTLSGQNARVSCFSDITATHIAPPIVQDNAGTAYFLSPSSGGNTVRRWAVEPLVSPFNASLRETSSIAIAPWSIPPDAAQPNGQRLDTLDGRFQSASIQLGTSLWNVHTIAVGSFARWRLYQFSTMGTTPSFTLTPTTDIGNNLDHLFNPSVAANATTAFVTSSRTIPSNAASGHAAMLIFSGPNNVSSGWTYDLIATSTQPFSIVGSIAEPNTSCNASLRGSCRWGNFSATQIDPSNPTVAWGFNELADGITQFDWGTRGAQVGSFVGSPSMNVAPARVAAGVRAAPGLTGSPTTVAAGGNLTATWSDIVSPTARDWIGLYAAGAPDTAYLVWIYVNCTVTPGSPAAAGHCVLQPPASLSGGTYELRLFSNDSFIRLATSNPLTVTSSSGPQLFVTSTTVAAGGSVLTFWSGIVSPTGTDWIGLYAAGAPDAAYLAWTYVNCATTPTNPIPAGLCNFLIPANVPAGTYELRLFPNDGFIRLATGNPFTVTSSGPVISVSPSTAGGGSVTAAWGGIPSPTARDWIGLYKRGTPDTAYLAWIYVSCSTTPGGPAAAGACPFPLPGGLPAGLYELRFLPNDGFSRLATSNPLIVN